MLLKREVSKKISKQSHSEIPFLNPPFLSVIITSLLTNYRSAVFVFASSDKTGEEKACVCGDASLSLVLLAKYILPFLIQQEH